MVKKIVWRARFNRAFFTKAFLHVVSPTNIFKLEFLMKWTHFSTLSFNLRCAHLSALNFVHDPLHGLANKIIPSVLIRPCAQSDRRRARRLLFEWCVLFDFWGPARRQFDSRPSSTIGHRLARRWMCISSICLAGRHHKVRLERRQIYCPSSSQLESVARALMSIKAY